jgi:hypothetical protein
VIVFPSGKDRFLVFEDLERRSPEGQVKTLAQVQQLRRIHWKDSNPDTVEGLANKLRVSPPPTHFWVFFPQELEKVLLEKELAYQGLKEDEIVRRRLETTFEAERQSDRWIVRVVEQKARPPRTGGESDNGPPRP